MMNNLENIKTMIMSYNTETILNVEFVKNYLRIDNSEDDLIIKNYIETAVLFAEKYLGIELCDKNVEYSFFILQNTKTLQNDIFRNINKDDIISIENNGTYIENFLVENDIVSFEEGIAGKLNITILKRASFKNISANLKQALLCHIASMYQNKDGDCEIPKTTLQIYDFNKDVKLGL